MQAETSPKKQDRVITIYTISSCQTRFLSILGVLLILILFLKLNQVGDRLNPQR